MCHLSPSELLLSSRLMFFIILWSSLQFWQEWVIKRRDHNYLCILCVYLYTFNKSFHMYTIFLHFIHLEFSPFCNSTLKNLTLKIICTTNPNQKEIVEIFHLNAFNFFIHKNKNIIAYILWITNWILTWNLFSVDSVLMSRNVDPSEFLLDLGFGGPSTSILARIPARFFTKSHVRIFVKLMKSFRIQL